MTAPYIVRFWNFDLSDSYEFPLDTNYEISNRQPLHVPRQRVIGQNYAVRLLGGGIGIKEVKQTSIRFYIVGNDGEITSAITELNKLYNFGLGFLENNEGLKAEASIAEMPEIRVGYNYHHALPIVTVFDVWSDYI
jgi:hypothetical protein